MSSLAKKVKQRLSHPEQEFEFEPSSSMDRLAKYGLRPLIMTEQLENRVSLGTQFYDVLQKVYTGKNLEEKMDALDQGLRLIMTVAQPWSRGHQVWSTFASQFRELRTKPAFMDTLIEEFIAMINHGWLPPDVTVNTPIVIFTPVSPRAPYDMGEFEVKTRKSETTQDETVDE